ncbi:GMC family oxidoreductase [Actinokineospora enzanensis]|uniref:GMC family oxidoreductase n=1 Tax=Actinokineospora enzanensis TaxID=155975 RepID=UPI000361F8F8|nr:GMC family oxidoreductase N-terminal domain-containing protein [Actinokineospora enzanensis]
MTTADYVIVGAGAAGCVLADRLSAGGAEVLLLEAGRPDPEREPDVRVPIRFPRTFGTDLDWGYRTVPQPGLDHRVIDYPRGRAVGGSSAIHAQLWTRGHPADYDGWAADGCAGWSHADLAPYVARAERDRIRLAGLRYPSPVTPDFLTACAQLGYDPASELPEGYSAAVATHHDGLRFSSADAYLGAARGRANLRVMANTLVRRVVFEGTRAVGVEIRTAQGIEEVRARREVLLAAGAIGSPHLLLRSGVGPADQLAEHGVPLVADAPGVGANLTDHVLVPMAFSGVGFASPGSTATDEDVQRYLRDREGPLESILSEATLFLRTDPDLPAPDIEIIMLLGALGAQESRAEHALSLGVVLLRPESRGAVRLASADPDAAPLIDPGLLTDPADLRTLTTGVRRAQEILTRPVMARWWDKPLTPGALSPEAADIADYVRRVGENIHHPVGTCRMGADPASVVDLALRVRGTDGLRVVDAAALPTIVRAHTHAPVTMFAERASDLVSADR